MVEEENMFHPLKVLLVEDQPESRMLLKQLLSELGVTQIYEANDGRVGMQLLDSVFDSMDLILCDWNMPALNGIEFLRQVRSTGSEVPFMMITGRGDHASVIEAKNYGVSGYIRKPFTATQMEAKLRILLQRMKAA